MKKNTAIWIIFFLALLVRVYKLNVLPWGFYEEEMTNAYVGRFIFENGRDLYGNRWPILYFDKFGDFPPVLPMYLAGFSTYIFGLTEFAARFPTALIGALTVFPLFGLAQLVFKNKNLSLFSALILATAPWHVVLSRTSAEGVIGLGVYTWALFWILKGIFEKDDKRIRWSLALFFLTYFLYPSLRLLVPVTILPLPLLVPRKEKALRKMLVMAVVGSFVLTGLIASTAWGRGRFLQTSLFASQEVSDRIRSNLTALSYGDGKQNIFVARLFHNKVVGYLREFIDQYMSYISPRHLFLVASGQPRYFNVPAQELLFFALMPLLFLGFLPVATSAVSALVIYIFYLLVVSPISSVLTVDFVPHVHRSVFMILPLILAATYGLSKIHRLLPQKMFVLFGLLLSFVLVLEFTYFWHQYVHHGDSYQSILRNDGDKELAQYLVAHRSEYDKIIMPPFERLPIYYLYFSKNFNPNLIGHFTSQLQMDKADNIEFFSDWCPTKYLTAAQVTKKTLIVQNGDCGSATGFKTLEITYRKDSTKAYRFEVPE